MNNFLRAVRLALRHRLTIVGVIASSLVVAALWGANIGAVYPLVEVVFENQSIPEWTENQIVRVEAAIQDRRREADNLRATLAAAPEDQRAQWTRRLSVAEMRIAADEQWLERIKWAQPHIARYAPATAFKTLLVVVLIILAGTLVKDLLLVVNVILVERLAQLATFDLRKQFYRRTLRMDLGAFGEDRTPRLMSHFTNDMSAMSSGIAVLFGKVIREPLKMISCLAGAAYVCPRLLILSLVLAPPAIYLIARLAQSLKRANRRAMEEMAQLYSVLSETFTGIQAVKAFTMERYERGRFHQVAKKYFRRAMRIITYDALTRPTTELMGMIMISAAILSGGYLVLNERTDLFGIRMCQRPLTFGSLMAFYGFLIGACDPARKLADVLQLLQRSLAGADRIYEMLDREPTVVERTDTWPIPDPPRELVFENVSFRYTPDHPVLSGINLRIPFGQSVAIVGPNGCGKSTLANLIPRFYDPDEGSIRIDRTDLRDLRLKSLRSEIGLVTQQTLLFDDTIMNNIRYGSPGASDEEVIQAARNAHASRFIEEKLEHGYQTIVGERGGKLSGGQRQRIALARAMLRNPRILLLDEATSQIDPESEQLIHQALRKFIRGRTTIMITHRLTTLDLAERILVMDSGEIVDSGGHDDLIRRCALYQRIYHAHLRESA